MGLKDVDVMASSVNPNQSNSLNWVCTVCTEMVSPKTKFSSEYDVYLIGTHLLVRVGT